jgi:sugar phosphate permease
MTVNQRDASDRPTASPGWYGVLLVAVMGAGFMVSQFLRNSTGALVPFLVGEFQLSSTELGLLAGGFFASFAAAMIPTGVLLDRYGPRVVTTGCMIIVGLGCIVFAQATGAGSLVAGRLLMGLGCAALLMGPLMVIGNWFAPVMFSTLTAIVMATGNVGSLISTAPLAAMTEWWGWRTVFVLAAVVAGIIAAAYWMMVRDRPAGQAHPARENWSEALTGLAVVLRTRDLAPIFAMHLVFYAMVAALVGMWGPVYLAAAYGMGAGETGQALFFIVAAIIAGMLILGPCDQVFGTRKWIVVASVAGMLAGLALLALDDHLSRYWALGAMIMIGFFGGASTVLLAHGRSLFGKSVLGRGLTVINTAVMAGVFVVQSASGFLANAFYPGAPTIDALPVDAIRLAFGFMAVVLIAGLVIYLLADDRPPGSGLDASQY